MQTCRPKTAGSLCRAADYECDLPEYCTGQSEYCPVDIYKMDTEICDSGKVKLVKDIKRWSSNHSYFKLCYFRPFVIKAHVGHVLISVNYFGGTREKLAMINATT